MLDIYGMHLWYNCITLLPDIMDLLKRLIKYLIVSGHYGNYLAISTTEHGAIAELILQAH
jgi:hypothetical protein